MKKSSYLDNNAFVLVETLLVSLTIAGILLFLYVQYSRVSDSYKRLSHYNTVESLYRTNYIKKVLLMKANAPFYNQVDSTKIYEITVETEIDGLGKLGDFWKDLGISKLYITTANADFKELDSSFQPFLNTISLESSDGEYAYRIFAKYNDGTFATLAFNNERGGE